MSNRTSQLYDFGPYRLDLARRVFTREGQVIPLAPKAFELLRLLVESAGRAFSKKELMVALWPDTFVEEANLSFQISVGFNRTPAGKPTAAVGFAIPLTSYPGMEGTPSLSPDGSQVAFSWNGETEDNFDIYVKLVGPGQPWRLTTNPARDEQPSWSPDGRFIAFNRYVNESTADLIVIPALGGGSERRLTTVVVMPTTLPL